MRRELRRERGELGTRAAVRGPRAQDPRPQHRAPPRAERPSSRRGWRGCAPRALDASLESRGAGPRSRTRMRRARDHPLRSGRGSIQPPRESERCGSPRGAEGRRLGRHNRRELEAPRRRGGWSETCGAMRPGGRGRCTGGCFVSLCAVFSLRLVFALGGLQGHKPGANSFEPRRSILSTGNLPRSSAPALPCEDEHLARLVARSTAHDGA